MISQQFCITWIDLDIECRWSLVINPPINENLSLPSSLYVSITDTSLVFNPLVTRNLLPVLFVLLRSLFRGRHCSKRGNNEANVNSHPGSEAHVGKEFPMYLILVQYSYRQATLSVWPTFIYLYFMPYNCWLMLLSEIITFLVDNWCRDTLISRIQCICSTTITPGSSLNANYHKVDELCGSQITSAIHYITVLL